MKQSAIALLDYLRSFQDRRNNKQIFILKYNTLRANIINNTNFSRVMKQVYRIRIDKLRQFCYDTNINSPETRSMIGSLEQLVTQRFYAFQKSKSN